MVFTHLSFKIFYIVSPSVYVHFRAMVVQAINYRLNIVQIWLATWLCGFEGNICNAYTVLSERLGTWGLLERVGGSGFYTMYHNA